MSCRVEDEVTWVACIAPKNMGITNKRVKEGMNGSKNERRPT